MLITNVALSVEEAKALVEGLNKLAPEAACYDQPDRYDVLKEAGLLKLYDELRIAVRWNEKLENAVRWTEDDGK